MSEEETKYIVCSDRTWLRVGHILDESGFVRLLASRLGPHLGFYCLHEEANATDVGVALDSAGSKIFSTFLADAEKLLAGLPAKELPNAKKEGDAPTRLYIDGEALEKLSALLNKLRTSLTKMGFVHTLITGH